MLRPLLFITVIVYSCSAPLSDKEQHDKDEISLIRVKRANERILYGNHQNSPRVKKADPATEVEPEKEDDTEESSLSDRHAEIGSVIKDLRVDDESSKDGASEFESEMTMGSPDSQEDSASTEDVAVPDETEDPLKQDLTEDEEAIEDLKGLAEENDLSKLKSSKIDDTDEEEKTNNIDELKDDFSKMLLGADGRYSPEVYEELKKYAALSSLYYPYASRVYYPSEETTENTEDEVKDEEPKHGHRRQERSAAKAAFTAEDMMGAGAKIRTKDRSKRDLRDEFGYPIDIYGGRDDSDYPVEEFQDYPMYEDDEGPYPGEDNIIDPEEEEIRELLDEELGRERIPYPFERQYRERYPYDIDTNDIRERLALMDILNDQEDDEYRPYKEESEPYEGDFYNDDPGMYNPSKRQFLSFVPGNRKRSSDFYPYAYGPDGKWGAMVEEEMEKRNEDAMYERLMELAKQLRSPEPMDADWQAIRKKK